MPVSSKLSRAVFQKLERDLVKLSSKPRAENIHSFRTGTRRLQILLGELSPSMDGNQKKLLKMLARIRKRAAKLRDLDTQLAALRSLKVAREPRRKTQVINHLIELRGRQEKKLKRSVEPQTAREIRWRLSRAREGFDPQECRDALTVARNMLRRISTDLPITETLLHRYRILGKRARYAAEFAESPAQAQHLIAQLKRLQDAPGDWHDWLTLNQTAREDLGDLRESALVAEVDNVTGAKFRHAVAVLTEVRLEMAEGAPRSAPGARIVNSVPPLFRQRDAGNSVTSYPSLL